MATTAPLRPAFVPSRSLLQALRWRLTSDSFCPHLVVLHPLQSNRRYCIALSRAGPYSSISIRPGRPGKIGRPGLYTQHLTRSFSSTSAVQAFWKWPFSSSFKKNISACDPLEPDDLPVSSFVDDYGYSRVRRSTNELKIRCTEFDESGNVKLVNGEYKKTELIAKYSLLPRDLRKIDSSMLPHILVRPSSILINLLHLRVLIKHDRVLVFDAYGSTDSYTQSVFMYDLEGKLRSAASESRQPNGLPYEFRALEAVLISVTGNLEGEFEGMREPIVRVLRELEEDIDRDKLRYLLVYSKRLGSFEQKARLVRDALDELLDADDDLAAMYLTEKATGVKPSRSETSDHSEIELLLESYNKVTDEIVHVAENLVSNIRNTEELVKAILDANRNSLMLLDLKFSVCTLGLGIGTFAAALYGMNLRNYMEESTIGFAAISAACVIGSAVVVVYGLRILRRIQRVRMWGDPHDRGRSLASITALHSPRKPMGSVGANPNSGNIITSNGNGGHSTYRRDGSNPAITVENGSSDPSAGATDHGAVTAKAARWRRALNQSHARREHEHASNVGVRDDHLAGLEHPPSLLGASSTRSPFMPTTPTTVTSGRSRRRHPGRE